MNMNKEQLNSLINLSINSQQKEIEQQKAQLSQLQSQPKQMDLTPLAALADAWSGQPGLARAYQAMKPQDNTMKIQGLQQQLMQQEQGLIGDRLSQLKVLSNLGQSQGFQSLPYKDQQKIRTDISKSDDYKRMRSINDLKSATQKYRDAVDTYGTVATGSNKTKMESLYRDLTVKYKEAAKLGALTGPDVALLEGAVPPATGLKGMWQDVMYGGKKGVIDTIDQIGVTLDDDFSAAEQSLRATYPDVAEEQIKNLISGKKELKNQGSGNKELEELEKKYGL